ncbi:hypothetical protein MMPV_002092 [Pyropia vietnamensis]
MLNNRPKQGAVAVDWRAALRGKRHTRRMFVFDWPPPPPTPPPLSTAAVADADADAAADARALRVVDGALGCAVWDGGLLLARYLHDVGQPLLAGATVLEVGAGCGLVGLVAARYAAAVTLTDYVPAVVANLAHNVRLNEVASWEDAQAEAADDDDEGASGRLCACVDDRSFGTDDGGAQRDGGEGDTNGRRADGNGDGDGDGRGDGGHRGRGWRLSIGPTVTVGHLDWETAGAVTSATSPPSVPPVCTRAVTPGFHTQPWVACTTCYGDSSTAGICAPCAAACHAGHDTTAGTSSPSRFRCDCTMGVCGGPSRPPPNVAIPPGGFDVVLGAECTYSMLSVEPLLRTLDAVTAPRGVYYAVMSEDRDGVAALVAGARAKGWAVDVRRVPPGLGGGAREWRYRDDERYLFYTFHRGGRGRWPALPLDSNAEAERTR